MAGGGKMMPSITKRLSLFVLVAACSLTVQAERLDTTTGGLAGVDAGAGNSKDPFGDDWPKGRGRELTGYLCNSCHSLAIVKQQGLSRGDWDELLDWMVEEQGMAELTDEQRDQVLDFLAANFGVDSR